MNKCLICSSPAKNKYCSAKCYNKSKFGRKRPDLVLRNKTSNPMLNQESLEKMRKSLTGKKQSEETKEKRAAKLRRYYAEHPEAKAQLAKNVWDKYTGKIAGTSWVKVRLKALERDNYKCTLCGEDSYRRLVVHHIDWNGKRRNRSHKDMNNDLSNLQTLCHKCHNGIHRHKSADYQERRDAIAP